MAQISQNTMIGLIQAMVDRQKLANQGLVSSSSSTNQDEENEIGLFTVDDPNLASVVLWMRKNEVKEIVSSYYGGGDSGDTENVYFDGAENHDSTVVSRNTSNERMLNGNLEIIVQSEYSDDLETVESLVQSKMTFDYVSRAGHEGFWNNEGGSGTLTITEDGKAVLDHVNYGAEDEQDEEVLIKPDNETVGAGLALIGQWLKDNNMGTVRLEFAGSCDDVYEYDVTVLNPDDENEHLDLVTPLTLEDGTKVSITDFMEDFGNELINESGNEDYHISGEESDGGGGNLVIDTNGECKVNMSYTVKSEEAYQHSFVIDPELLISNPLIAKKRHALK